MSLKNIIPGTLLSLMLAAAPVQTACTDAPAAGKQKEVSIRKINQESENSEGFSENLSGLEKLIISGRGEPELEIPPLIKSYCGYRLKKKVCYWLSEEEYEQVKAHRSSKVIEGENGEKIKSGPALKNYQTAPYLGFIALMRHEPFIDFMTDYYELDPMQILEVIAQETAFNIGIRGEDGERGIGQKMEGTARELVNKITDPDNDLYYPFLDKKDYRFWKLSSDYRLNIILTAAMIKTAHSNLEKVLEGKDMTREELAEKMRDIGQNCNFPYLRKLTQEEKKRKEEEKKTKKPSKEKKKKFAHYNVTQKRVKAINQFWEENNVELRDFDYLPYNGGRRAIDNVLGGNAIREVLMYNLTAYSRNKETVERFMSLHKNIGSI